MPLKHIFVKRRKTMKKIIVCALAALMVIPFALLASSDVAVPAEPTLTSDVVVYAADNVCPAGSTSQVDGGASAEAPLKMLGAAQKTVLYNKLANGGKLVFVGKGYFDSGNPTFPATTSPVLITGNDGTRDFISRDTEGNISYMSASGGNAGQFGMFMLSTGVTYTFECDVIFRDTVILNRLSANAATTASNIPTIVVKKSAVIDSSVAFAKMKGNVGYNMQVEEGAFLYLHADAAGFEKYTGTGTIVIGDEIKGSVTADMFDGFNGNVVDKNGKAVFGAVETDPETDPETDAPDTPDTTPVITVPVYTGSDKVYVAFDKYPVNPVGTTNTTTFINADTFANGGGTLAKPYKCSGGWLPFAQQYPNGAVVVAVGKCYVGGTVSIPASTQPYVFTALDNGIDYTSRLENGNINTSQAAATPGQYGMFIVKESSTLEFKGDVIFENIVILNRLATATVSKIPTIVFSGTGYIKDSTTFAKMGGNLGYIAEIPAGGCLILEKLGFENYKGEGTIAVSDALKSTVTEADFAGFGGIVTDMNGNIIFNFKGGSTPDTEPDAPETNAPDTEYVPGDTTPVELPAKPEPSTGKNLFTAHDKNPDLGITASLTGGDSANDPFQTSKGWTGMADKYKDGAKIVVVGKGFFGMDEVISANGTLVFTSKHDGVDYTSKDSNGKPLFMNAAGQNAGQYGMLMLKEDAIVTFDCDVIFDDIIVLGRLSANGVAGGHSEGTIVIKKRLWVKDNVGFEVMTGNVNHILELEAGAVAFLDAAGFTGYKGTGTIVLGDAIKDKFTAADFDGFKGKVVDKDGTVLFSFVEDPNAPIVIPARPTYTDGNKFFIAHDNNPERDIIGSPTGGTYAAVPYQTVKGWTTVSNWLKTNNGGTLVVVGKGHIGGDFAFPLTDAPIVFTAKNDGVSYISKNENGSIKYINEKGGNDGQYGMFMIAEGKKITFNGDVIFKDIVILSRQSKASYNKGTKPATIVVKKSLTIEESVKFANMTSGRNYILQVDEGAYAYLDRAGFFNYTGKGTIVIGDEIKDKVTAEMFGGFKGKVVDSQGTQLFDMIPDNPPTGDNFNAAFVAIIAVCALTVGAVLTLGVATKRREQY